MVMGGYAGRREGKLWEQEQEESTYIIKDEALLWTVPHSTPASRGHGCPLPWKLRESPAPPGQQCRPGGGCYGAYDTWLTRTRRRFHTKYPPLCQAKHQMSLKRGISDKR
ncbi:hypothetical protein Pcinc_001522 [Petrolisthes cinctipes]|uniref:Uncharacterized protein n=1 Tax=Petrolisthes cinctipes TaxID=88211 RepID=A0AAE1GL42_PETCI|nr:hypothetical protein Pcinc_001522 [Petrolisthes cinctipes]